MLYTAIKDESTSTLIHMYGVKREAYLKVDSEQFLPMEVYHY